MAFAQAEVKTVADSTEHILDLETCAIENTSFGDGEEVVYKLYYNWNFIWIPAGEVVFTTKDVGDAYHLSAVGKTYKSYDWFFKVRDHYQCFVDKESLLPKVAIRDVAEGKYRLYDKITFDQENQKATSLRGNSKEKAFSREYEVGSCMHDILSIVYYTRNFDYDQYEAGQKFPVKIFMDKEVWPLQVSYKGKEQNVKIKGNGRYNTIKFSPEVISGNIFAEGTQMNVWVSDDQNRVPLLIESPVSVGSVKAVLKSYTGLKYEMSARVEN